MTANQMIMHFAGLQMMPMASILTVKQVKQKGDTDVSKYNFFKLWMQIAQIECKNSTYRAYKNGAEAYQDDKKKFQQFFSRNGKGEWYHKPQDADNFSV